MSDPMHFFGPDSGDHVSCLPGPRCRELGQTSFVAFSPSPVRAGPPRARFRLRAAGMDRPDG